MNVITDTALIGQQGMPQTLTGELDFSVLLAICPSWKTPIGVFVSQGGQGHQCFEFAKSSEPLSDDLLNKRRLYMSGNFARALESSGGFNSIVSTLQQQGLEPAEALKFAERLDAVDSEAATLAARTYVDPAKATLVIVGDASQFLDDLKEILPDVEVIAADDVDLSLASLRKVADEASTEAE